MLLLFLWTKIYEHCESYLQLKILFPSNFLLQFGVLEARN